MAEAVRHPALHIARVAAADEILRGVGTDKAETLHVKIEFQNVQDFASETFQRNRNGFRHAHDGDVLFDVDFVLAARNHGGKKENRQANFQNVETILFHPSDRLALRLKLMV